MKRTKFEERKYFSKGPFLSWRDFVRFCIEQYTVNSLYCGHPRDHELVSLIARVGIYFSQTSVLYFCRGFSCCPYYRGVLNSEESARRELIAFNKQIRAYLLWFDNI